MREGKDFSKDDNGPGAWLLGDRGWPRCDICGTVMERDVNNCGTGLFAAKCDRDGFRLTFDSCRRGHRYCAWERLQFRDDDL